MTRSSDMQAKQHWESVYNSKATDAVSWFQPHAELSLELIRATGTEKRASIIDVGGGVSTLVDDLLAEGYLDVTVLDLSHAALVAAQRRLGAQGQRVCWIEADITAVELPQKRYDVWHDRAVFHFLTTPEAREAYVQTVLRAVKPGGHVIVATFAEDGPEQCSGLPVMRYRPDELHDEFGAAFTLLKHQKEMHQTPIGKKQSFIYCYCRRTEF